MNKVVAYASTRNRYEALRTAINSVKRNNPDIEVIVFAEDDDIGANCKVINLHGGCEYTDGVNSNANSWTERANNPKIVHYAGFGKWDDKELYIKYKE